ncbi:MAG: CDP-alcohol phosphatidyltransferase family protein [Nitrososphaerota archaeon]|nr:CDP-alcohol phosphatidyltransferase family protein [Nitrososphaerota archaeon]
MVLNRIRNSIKPLVDSIGRSFESTRLSPNFWTSFGFLVSVIAGLFYALKPDQPYLAGLLILLSGFFDVVDGAVARIANKISKAGSFNDSTLDRLAEVAIYAGILYGGYTSPLLILLALSFSLLVSYTRAKGDSLGVALSGIGIGERAERLIVLVIFSLLGFVNFGVIVVLVIAAFTFLQRYLVIIRKLKST